MSRLLESIPAWISPGLHATKLLGTSWSGNCSCVMEDRPTEQSAAEARQAVKVWPMKYVLGIGTAGAAIALLVAWLLIR